MSDQVLPFPDPDFEIPDFWCPHDDPDVDRPLDATTILCPCVACTAAIRRHAEREPRFIMGIKTNADRILVTIEYLAEVMDQDRDLAPLMYVEEDWVRDIFIPHPEPFLLSPQRWWSLTCWEDEKAEGRRHKFHAKAKRRPKAVAKRAADRWKAEHANDPVFTPVPFRPLAEAVEPVRGRHHDLLAAVARWSLEHGAGIDTDVLALILGAVEEGFERVTPTLWRRDAIVDTLRTDALNWCSLSHVEPPRTMAATLWRYFDYLHDTGGFDPASDPLAELRKPLRCYGGLDADGNEDPDPNRERPPCECFVPYRRPPTTAA